MANQHLKYSFLNGLIISGNTFSGNTFAINNPNSGLYIGGSGAGSYRDLVGYPHMLRIVNHNEDIGQDDYFEDLEWTILHPNECPRHMTIANNEADAILPPYVRRIKSPLGGSQYDAFEIYECEMATEIKRHGIDRLMMSWTDLEPGDYRVQLEISKEGQYTASSGWNQQTYDLPSRIVLL